MRAQNQHQDWPSQERYRLKVRKLLSQSICHLKAFCLFEQEACLWFVCIGCPYTAVLLLWLRHSELADWCQHRDLVAASRWCACTKPLLNEHPFAPFWSMKSQARSLSLSNHEVISDVSKCQFSTDNPAFQIGRLKAKNQHDLILESLACAT